MALEIKVPNVGESITEVTIAQWMKKSGERGEEEGRARTAAAPATATATAAAATATPNSTRTPRTEKDAVKPKSPPV